MTTAADLIREKSCTSACIAAITEPIRCTCPCLGELHGVLRDADLTTLLDARRWRRLHRLTDLEVLSA